MIRLLVMILLLSSCAATPKVDQQLIREIRNVAEFICECGYKSITLFRSSNEACMVKCEKEVRLPISKMVGHYKATMWVSCKAIDLSEWEVTK